ncbi:hypothetical protein SteCoe_9394 [Stentor coeruleus]|uniref:Uncharacterized protein n=1 Tax=Stentor coeruleus TaxID=5963 RepID=A0A1R2CHU3_9CILI|nr:hypothetical protein SteCoe_9394 [Stentor coeruleus]
MIKGSKIAFDFPEKRVLKKPPTSSREILINSLILGGFVCAIFNKGTCKTPVFLWLAVQICFSILILMICLLSLFTSFYLHFEAVLKTLKFILYILNVFWFPFGAYWIYSDPLCSSTWYSAYILIYFFNSLLGIFALVCIVLLCFLLVPELFKTKKS